MFENQPKGLYALSLANTGERFGYYTMIAVFVLFLKANFGLSPGAAGAIYSTFMGLVYFLPFVGGIFADRWGYGKMVTIGIVVMFFGYLFLSVPLGGNTTALVAMLAALFMIAWGTGLFKGNLQVMIGNLYDDPKYSAQRDSGFSIFYMAINIGALFAPTAAIKIMEYTQTHFGVSVEDSYHYAFAVACLSLVVSIAIYYGFRSTFRNAEISKTSAKPGSNEPVEQLSKAETRQRITALCLVFAVVLFFWMAFQQNGLTLTYFADEFTAKSSSGVESMTFDVLNLVALIFVVYALFSLFQSKTAKGRIISVVVIVAAVSYLVWKYSNLEGSVAVAAPIFQHFNPCFVVMLTPVSIALFGWLAKRGKEPSAPRKIAYGMLVAAVAYCVLLVGSLNLLSPDAQKAAGDAATFVSPNWLISTYLLLTCGELLLSPIGISFVSKVAPPKYKGMMMGGWFVATAVGNLLVSVGGFVWGSLPLWAVWSIFAVLCLLSALFMLSIMKRLEKVS